LSLFCNKTRRGLWVNIVKVGIDISLCRALPYQDKEGLYTMKYLCPLSQY
jgi:hypothetical protein